MARNGELLAILWMITMLVFGHLGIMYMTTLFIMLLPPVISTTVSALIMFFTLASGRELDVCVHASALNLVSAAIYDAIILVKFFQESSVIGWLMVLLDVSYAFPILFLSYVLREMSKEGEKEKEME